MPIQGSLDEVSLADVLQLLSLGKKTGRLSLDDGATQGHIYLDAGRICHATVDNRRDRLGDVLVKAGKIRQQQLDEAIEQQGHDRKRSLDQILVGSGSVDRKELDRFVSAQVEEAVFFMFTWKRGSFTYQSRIRPEDTDFFVSLDPQALLLEAARRVDEWTLLKQKIPALTMVFCLDRARLDTARVTLTEEQQRILPLLDGARDVTGIVEATGLVEFDVAKALYGLITAGFAHLVERRSEVRHLDYREFLAYLVREAEFADPERRRQAARHILDCSVCTDRLQRIHRHTGEMAQVEATAVAAPAEPSSESGAGSPPAPGVPSTELVESVAAEQAGAPRVEERRRARSDRRKGERRGGDRRVATRPGLSLAWPVEQRSGKDRRKRDRRTSERRGRGAARRHSASHADTAAPERAAVASPRSRAAAVEVHVATPKAAQAPGRRISADASPMTKEPATTASGSQRAPAPEPSRAAGGTLLQAPEGDVVTSPSPGARRHRRSSDIEWLVTPDDAIELLRHQPSKASRASPRRPAPQPAASRPAERPKRDRPSETPVGVAERHTTPRVQTAAELVESWKHVAARVDPIATTRGQGVATGSAVISRPRTTRTPQPTRRWWLIVAATFVTAAGIGWLTGSQMGRGSNTGTETTVPAENGTRARSPGSKLPVLTTDTGVRAPALAPQIGDTTGARPSRGSTGQVARAGRSPLSAAPGGEARQPRAARTSTSPSPDRAAGPPAAAPERSPATAVVPIQTPSRPAVAADTRPEPEATVASVRGVVRDAQTGMPLAGARVSITGTSLAIETDASGGYEIRDVPEGSMTVEAAADGYLPRSVAVSAVTPRAPLELDVALRRPPTAVQPDTGLTTGGWLTASRAEAAAVLGQPVAAIADLWIESITMRAESSRPRIRIAHLTGSGERIVLIETRAGGFARPGPARVTALRIMPPSEAYPVTTGTASFGNLLVTAQTGLAPDSVRVLLGRLVEMRGESR